MAPDRTQKGFSESPRAGTRPGFAFVGARLGTWGSDSSHISLFLCMTQVTENTSSVDLGVTNNCRVGELANTESVINANQLVLT